MAKWGKMDFKQFEKMTKNFEAAVKAEAGEELVKGILLEIANRTLRKTKKRTPVGDYGTYDYTITRGKNKGKVIKKPKPRADGHVGGTLRKGWYITNVSRVGNDFQVTLYNNVEYASFVEYGHRKRNNKGWVEGKFMMTIAIKEVARQLQQVGDKHSRIALEKLFR